MNPIWTHGQPNLGFKSLLSKNQFILTYCNHALKIVITADGYLFLFRSHSATYFLMLKPPFPSIQSTCSRFSPRVFNPFFPSDESILDESSFPSSFYIVFHIFPSSFHSFTNPMVFPISSMFFREHPPKLNSLSSGPSSRR